MSFPEQDDIEALAGEERVSAASRARDQEKETGGEKGRDGAHDTIRRYFQDISKLSMLSADEERALAWRIHQVA